MSSGQYFHVVDEAGLGHIVGGNDYPRHATETESIHKSEDSRYRPYAPVEPQFSEDAGIGQRVVGEFAAGAEQPECNRDFETRAGFAYTGWSEIHGDATQWPGEL